MPLFRSASQGFKFALTRVSFSARFSEMVALTESLPIRSAVIITSADVINLIGGVGTTRPLADASGISESFSP